MNARTGLRYPALDPLWLSLTWILDHFVACYLIGMVCGWIAIAGMTFPHMRAEYPSLTSHRDCMSDVGFALTWGAWSSLLWPASVPAIYAMTGFGEDGWEFPHPSLCGPQQ